MNELSNRSNSARYSIAEVQELTGLPGRTVRFYISQGLIPPAHGRGPGATYDRGQVERLQLIQHMRSEGTSLIKIKERLDGLSDAQILSLVESEAAPIGDNWRRIQLHPDIELHVRNKPLPEGKHLDDTVQWILNTLRPELDRLSHRQSGRQQR